MHDPTARVTVHAARNIVIIISALDEEDVTLVYARGGVWQIRIVCVVGGYLTTLDSQQASIYHN